MAAAVLRPRGRLSASLVVEQLAVQSVCGDCLRGAGLLPGREAVGTTQASLRTARCQHQCQGSYKYPSAFPRGYESEKPKCIACALSHANAGVTRSEEHTSELQSLMRISYAVFCLKKKKNQ